MLRSAFLPVCILSAAFLCSCSSKKDPIAKQNNDPFSVNKQIAAETGLDMDSIQLHFPDVQPTRFTVTSARSSVITAANGLKVTVDPSVLETETGKPVRGKINVSIIELRDTKDFLRANTATVSDGRLLASGGSYYIGMNADGEKLRIKKGKALAVEFPKIREKEMELFYGERNAEGNMNWKPAGIPLRDPVRDETVDFMDRSGWDYSVLPGFALDTSGEPKIFRTLHEKVFLYNHHITISALLDSVNKHERRLFIDTLNMWPVLREPLKPGQRVDTGFLLSTYGPQKQFIIKSVKQEEMMKAKKSAMDSVKNIARASYESKTLTGQILKYYAPAQVTALGWINCDRFYKEPCSDAEVEIPIAMANSKINYFLIYPSINSMSTDKGVPNKNGVLVLPALPLNREINFIGFVKSKGKIYQCQQKFTTSSKGRIKADFTEVSAEELRQKFGANIRT